MPGSDIELQARSASGPQSDSSPAKSGRRRAYERKPRLSRPFGWSEGTDSAQRRGNSAHDALSKSQKEVVVSLRLQAVELLFGLTGEHVRAWPGVWVFCKHLESCFEPLMSGDFAVIWRILGRHPPTDAVECWYWCFAVIEAFVALEGDSFSMEKAYQRLTAKSEAASSTEIDTTNKHQALFAIFMVLCWASFLLDPISISQRESSPIRPISSITFGTEDAPQQQQLQQVWKRPVTKLVRLFRHSADVDPGPTSDSEPSLGILYESSLNYFSLLRIGHVRLQWVDTLTSHLVFDHRTRTLSVFRFPSFCLSSILGKRKVKIVQQWVACFPKHDFPLIKQRVTAELMPCHFHTETPSDDSDLLYREVLLSYRLLFAQSSRSRKLVKNILNQLKPSTDVDPFLVIICTTPLSSGFFPWGNNKSKIPPNIFPSSSLDLSNFLQQSDSYSARDDFPVLGARMLSLQRYNMRQQPSKMKDLWRDQRNPLQWYTFWAVVWIGGAGILFSFLQLLVAVAQLYVSIRSPDMVS